jgi:CheY-like chemotaxis protein
VILIVDDSRDNATALSRLLKRAGYPSSILSCGPELFAFLRDNPAPHLIILDLMMPEIDGFSCLQNIRAHPEWRAIPVLIYSADFDDNHRQRTMDLGAQDYVVKGSLGWEQLLATVQKHATAH